MIIFAIKAKICKNIKLIFLFEYQYTHQDLNKKGYHLANIKENIYSFIIRYKYLNEI